MSQELSNADRVALLAAREAKSPTPIERQYLSSDERIKADSVQSASANLHAALALLKQHANHLAANPQSESGWRAYERLFCSIERAAGTLANLTGKSVTIPERLQRAAMPLKVVQPGDWIDESKVDQPSWMSDANKRRKRSEAIAKENANARAERMAAVTGAGLMRHGK